MGKWLIITHPIPTVTSVTPTFWVWGGVGMAQAVALAVSWAVGFDVGLSGGIGLVGYPIGGVATRQPHLVMGRENGAWQHHWPWP